jgi:hypothetical protein
MGDVSEGVAMKTRGVLRQEVTGRLRNCIVGRIITYTRNILTMAVK